jgi:hypothetical protein
MLMSLGKGTGTDCGPRVADSSQPLMAACLLLTPAPRYLLPACCLLLPLPAARETELLHIGHNGHHTHSTTPTCLTMSF